MGDLDGDPRNSNQGATSSKRTREFEKKEQTAGRRLGDFDGDPRNSLQGADSSKGTREFQKKEQTARKKVENVERG